MIKYKTYLRSFKGILIKGMALRRSRGRPLSSQESEEEPSEWIPSKTLRKLTKGIRQKAPMKWSRPIRFEKLMDDLPPSYSIEQDLE